MSPTQNASHGGRGKRKSKRQQRDGNKGHRTNSGGAPQRPLPGCGREAQPGGGNSACVENTSACEAEAAIHNGTGRDDSGGDGTLGDRGSPMSSVTPSATGGTAGGRGPAGSWRRRCGRPPRRAAAVTPAGWPTVDGVG